MTVTRSQQKQLTDDEWRELGDRCHALNKDLVRAISSSSHGIPKTLLEELHRSVKHLDRFRSRAEDRMMEQKPHLDVDVFYGERKNWRE